MLPSLEMIVVRAIHKLYRDMEPKPWGWHHHFVRLSVELQVCKWPWNPVHYWKLLDPAVVVWFIRYALEQSSKLLSFWYIPFCQTWCVELWATNLMECAWPWKRGWHYLSSFRSGCSSCCDWVWCFSSLVELLLFPSTSILIAALRMVGNIATGDDLQTRVG